MANKLGPQPSNPPWNFE